MEAAEPLNLDRRRLLKGAVLLLSASVLPQALASSLDTAASAESWQTLFPDLKTAAAFGRQYLRQHQQEASGPWLTERLLGGELPARAQQSHYPHERPDRS